MKHWLYRYWLWIALVVFFVAYYPRFIADGNGIRLYTQAAQCLLDNRILQNCTWSFTYPPAFAFVMIPFAPLPMWLCLLIWYGITIVAIVGSFKLSEQIAGRLFADSFSKNELAWVRLISIALSFKFVLAVLETGSYDALSLVFILWGLAALADRRDGVAGAALGFAAAIKATPLIFLPYLLFKKRFAAAAGFAIVLLVVSFAPDAFFTPTGGVAGYLRTWLYQVAGASLAFDPSAGLLLFWVGPSALNHSLRGAVSLQIDEHSHAGLHKFIVYGVDLAFVIFASALIAFRKVQRDNIAVDGSILLIGALLLSPMTSRSHYVALVLPYVMLTMVVLRDQVTRRTGIIILATSFFFLTLTSNDVVGKTISDWAYVHSFLVIGALTLMIYIAVIAWNPAVLREAKPFEPSTRWGESSGPNLSKKTGAEWQRMS
jgi:Glycosyltransferase family 87